MKRILKNFKDFSINENIENELPMETSDMEISDMETSSEMGTMDIKEIEEEESPLSQLSEQSGLPINKDDKGDFLKTGDGDVIRYFSETGYYNETKRKKYGEDIQSALAEIGEVKQLPVTESKKKCCLPGQCGCKSKRK
jgi:hypothetical protein